MVTNHIEALEECLNCPAISTEAKEHIEKLYNQMVERKKNRPPAKKTVDNDILRSAITANLTKGVEYTGERIVDILKAVTGDNTITIHKALGVGRTVGLHKTLTVKEIDGHKYPTFSL